VGKATARRLEELFGGVDLVPEVMTGEGLAAALKDIGSPSGWRVLFPRADQARPDLPRGLRQAGARVDEVVAYRTVPSDVDVGPVRAALLEGKIDAVTFASGSAVRAFAEKLGAGLLEEPARRPRVASIGPSTSKTLRDLGMIVDEEATRSDMRELARAVARALARGPLPARPGGPDRPPEAGGGSPA
jgi:uroporphyrinogen III methyltransferase/synthase